MLYIINNINYRFYKRQAENCNGKYWLTETETYNIDMDIGVLMAQSH